MLGNFKIFESIISKNPSEATDYIDYLKFTKSRSNFSWGRNVDDLSARVALCSTPSSPSRSNDGRISTNEEFVSVGILVLTVAQTLSLQCWFKHACIHCSQPHKGKSRTSVAGSSKRSDKWLPTCTVNEHDSFLIPLWGLSFKIPGLGKRSFASLPFCTPGELVQAQ